MAGRGGNKTTGDKIPAAQASDDDLIWGINAVREALAQPASTINEVLVQRGIAGVRLQEIIDVAKERGIAVRFVEADRMRVARSCRHQGVVARQSAAKLLSLDELLPKIAGDTPGSSPRLLALDSIQDPRNLGSILRSALAAGFHHVILTRDRSVPVTGTVARTSAGAVAHLSLCQVVNLSDALNTLKEHGFWVYGAVAEAGVPSVYATDFSGPVCLVIGSEGKGLRPLVRQQCDHLVTIPMRAAFDSLNASVAAAVIMFEIARRSL
ncbi:MAG: 23S rRNA (guanosine(2251)-2'-O)-methyltransferase RlmB [Proteobacteria bacterium]|nr:23S rRNA (guanosine(2251)-2'-O)-methyltransferase RlmB [Pseudomonadota bacterium]